MAVYLVSQGVQLATAMLLARGAGPRLELRVDLTRVRPLLGEAIRFVAVGLTSSALGSLAVLALARLATPGETARYGAALNFLDAWFTVLFLSHGGTELNPFVDELLMLGTWPFILVKSLGIGICCVVLTLTRKFWMSRLGLGFVFTGYTLLLGWHLFLLTRLDSI